MSRQDLRLERLGERHDLATFDFGNDEFDGWLKRHALAAQNMGSGRTFVIVDDLRVAGYLNLTMASVLRQERLYRRFKDIRASLQTEADG